MRLKTFEDALDLLNHARCHFTLDKFTEVMFWQDEHQEYVEQKYRAFVDNPLKFWTSLDSAYREAVFKAAYQSRTASDGQ